MAMLSRPAFAFLAVAGVVLAAGCGMLGEDPTVHPPAGQPDIPGHISADAPSPSPQPEPEPEAEPEPEPPSVVEATARYLFFG
ncbi:MAG: hypothetical protein FWG16_03265, partial [Micrococcales bacterium]|nr:hypothetical protein [Micrococcales bacterium]